MKELCSNHPEKEALSFCYSCKRYFCVDCLNEGSTYYYCDDEKCRPYFKAEIIKSIENLPHFCEKCYAETTDENAGNTTTINLIGTRLMGRKNPCPNCGSVITSKWIWFMFPIFKSGTYRIIYTGHSEYLSRKLK